MTQKNIFVIPHKNIFIIFAPLHNKAVCLNQEAGNLISSLGDNWVEEIRTKEPTLYNELSAQGLFEERQPEDSFPEKNNVFAPTHVTLAITSDCSLRCIYCYARAGERKHTMPLWMAQKSIDFVIQNAIAKGAQKIKVVFHGEGEATKKFKLLTKIVDYANETCSRNDLSCSYNMATNCVHNKSIIKFLHHNKFSVMASVDGTKNVHDHNRPFPDGRGSFDMVINTLRQFEDAGINYGIRSTVIPGFESDMPQFTEFVADNLRTKHLHFEPLNYAGRASIMDSSEAHLHRFYREYMKALEIARNSDRELSLRYSGCNYERIGNHFCSANGVGNTNFIVSARGCISSCMEVTSVRNPHASLFMYGKVTMDRENPIILNESRMHYLNSLNVDKFRRCQECFAKWNCRGDCLHRAVVGGSTIPELKSDGRCWLNRELLKTELEHNLLRTISVPEGDFVA